MSSNWLVRRQNGFTIRARPAPKSSATAPKTTRRRRLNAGDHGPEMLLSKGITVLQTPAWGTVSKPPWDARHGRTGRVSDPGCARTGPSLETAREELFVPSPFWRRVARLLLFSLPGAKRNGTTVQRTQPQRRTIMNFIIYLIIGGLIGWIAR